MLSVTMNEVFREHRLEPVVICVVGPNGSGKSSAVQLLGIADPGDGFDSNHIRFDYEPGKTFLRFVNPDEFSLQIREANPGMSQEIADRIAASLAEAKRQALAETRSDFGFETVGSHESKPQFLRELKESGYFVTILFVGTESPEINKHRVELRVAAGGHDVEPGKVESRYLRTMGLLREYFDVADYMAIYDNSLDISEGGPRLLAIKNPDGALSTTEFCDEVEWIRTYLIDRV